MSLTPNDIVHEAHPEGGRYLAHLEGVADAAVLEYAHDRESGHVIAKHTTVPESLRGLGVARVLVERLVQDARHRGWRVRPTCSYVRAQAERTPEWADVFLLS